jgi:hypothetical protein
VRLIIAECHITRDRYQEVDGLRKKITLSGFRGEK